MKKGQKTLVWQHIERAYKVGFLGGCILCMMAGTGLGQTDAERIAELERKIDALSAEMEKVRYKDVFVKPGETKFGLGPAASKTYFNEEGVSIGGYGEGLYQNFDGEDPDEADFLRAVLYFGYKFNDRWVLNTELEFEHASTDKDGSTSVEFAYLDYLHSDELNLRMGLVLIPMGFVNELHEPTVFLGARRSDVESLIIPTTWRENGVGLLGQLGESIAYKAYLVNGLKAEDFSEKGLRGGRQKGSKALAEDLAGVLRVDYTPASSFLVGGSVYFGNSGQDLEADVQTTIWEVHAEWKAKGLQLRALGTIASLDDVEALNRIIATEDGVTPEDGMIESVGEELWGWYVEAGYDVLNPYGFEEKSLTPFVRYEQYDTQSDIPSGFQRSGDYDVEVVTVGLNYKPLDEIVFKADYQFYDNDTGSRADQFNLSMGYVF